LAFIDAAIQTNILKSVLCKDELVQILHRESQRDWHIYVGRQVRKKAVIEHIGRYVRKPPISQRRLRRLDDDRVEYIAKDTKNERMRPMTYTNREFLSLLLPHVADRYCNSMRYFGLLAPRSKGLLSVVFDLLKQKRKPKPPRLSWALSLERTFHNNPLIGRDGSILRRVGYLEPLFGAQCPQGSPQNRPTVVTSKPANESGLGLSCFTPLPPVEASLFSCANSVDRI
jgi:hypothetical protein